jgi:hypothetical protein
MAAVAAAGWPAVRLSSRTAHRKKAARRRLDPGGHAPIRGILVHYRRVARPGPRKNQFSRRSFP